MFSISSVTVISFVFFEQVIVRVHGRGSVLAQAIRRSPKEASSVVAYAVAIGMSFWLPWLSALLYAGVAILWLIPDRRIERRLARTEGDVEQLSERELEVLVLAGQGLPGHEVARLLSITERTVAAHLTSVYGKLGAKNKTEAILLALKRGVILLDQLHLIDS